MKIEMSVPITKRDVAKMQVFGWANWSVKADGNIVTDLGNDQIPPEVLEKAAYDFVLRYREGKQEHEGPPVARLIESCFVTAEKLDAMGIKTEGRFKGAAWFVGFKVDDPEVWAKVESGELAAFSIGGIAMVEEAIA